MNVGEEDGGGLVDHVDGGRGLRGRCVTFKEAEKSYQSDRLSLEKFFPHFFVYLRRF